ncbi:MAG: hypothetical protein AAF702_00700 [Chloroflexota bacterium]
MKQITIFIENKEKVKLLSSLLNALDFVKSVRIDTVEIDRVEADTEETNQEDSNADFFALAGIWNNRDIDLSMIRTQAWPSRS